MDIDLIHLCVGSMSRTKHTKDDTTGKKNIKCSWFKWNIKKLILQSYLKKKYYIMTKSGLFQQTR